MNNRYLILVVTMLAVAGCNKPAGESTTKEMPAAPAGKADSIVSASVTPSNFRLLTAVEFSGMITKMDAKAQKWKICHDVDHNEHPGGKAIHFAKGQDITITENANKTVTLAFTAGGVAQSVTLYNATGTVHTGGLPIAHDNNGSNEMFYHFIKYQPVAPIVNYQNCKKDKDTRDIQICWLEDGKLQCNDRLGDGGHAHVQIP